MTQEQEATTVSVILGVNGATGRPTVTVDDTRERVHVRVSDDLSVAGSCEDVLAFVTGLHDAVVGATPLHLLMDESEKDRAEEAGQT